MAGDELSPEEEEKTYALIVENAQGTLIELSKDYEGLKHDAQQTLTVSAVLLGLLLNLVRLPGANQWPGYMKLALTLATVILFFTAAFSLFAQRSRAFMIGYIKPAYLHKNFSFKPPVEIYRAQLDALIKSLEPANIRINCLSRAVNRLKFSLIIAVLLIGVVVLGSVNQELLEQLIGVVFQ